MASQREERTVAVVGGGGVGKSACTVQLISNEFIEEVNPTIEGTWLR
jgi:GTPase KRas protein